MAKNRGGHRPGGGIASKQHVQIPVRTGTGNRGASPGGVGQLGASQGNHITSTVNTNYRGEPLHGVPTLNTGVKFGNEVALNSKTAPGQGRTTHASGSQGTWGVVNQGNPPPNRRSFE